MTGERERGNQQKEPQRRGKEQRTGRFAVEKIDLLERQALGLGDEEVGEDQAADAGRAPDKEHLDAQIRSLHPVHPRCRWIDEVGRGVGDAEVPEPVGGDGEGHTLGTDSEGLEGACA